MPGCITLNQLFIQFSKDMHKIVKEKDPNYVVPEKVDCLCKIKDSLEPFHFCPYHKDTNK